MLETVKILKAMIIMKFSLILIKFKELIWWYNKNKIQIVDVVRVT